MSNENKCKVCTIDGCSKCSFSEFSGIEVCTQCKNPWFLQLDLRSNPPSKCIVLKECNGDFSPSITSAGVLTCN